MRKYIGDIRFTCLESQTLAKSNPVSKSFLLRNEANPATQVNI